MNLSQLCISTRANQLLRWQQAFPQGRILAKVEQLNNYLISPSLVWIHSDGLKNQQLENIIAKASRHENCRYIVVISCVPNQPDTFAALAAGASGYCHALSIPELYKKIALVIANDGLWIGRDLLNQLAGNITGQLPPSESLTTSIMAKLSTREQDVVQQVQQGASNKEISSTLNITERTVKAHLGSIFHKLEIRDRLQLILLFSDAPS